MTGFILTWYICLVHTFVMYLYISKIYFSEISLSLKYIGKHQTFLNTLPGRKHAYVSK